MTLDYALRVSIGATQAESLVADLVGKLTSGKSFSDKPQLDVSFAFCPYLNIRYCAYLSAL